MDATEKTPVIRGCTTCGFGLRRTRKNEHVGPAILCNSPKARFLLVAAETGDAGACGPDLKNYKQRTQRPVMA